jgi:hypothetical protein
MQLDLTAGVKTQFYHTLDGAYLLPEHSKGAFIMF